MKLSNVILGLSLAAFVGFASHTFADDTKVAGKKSLENRIAELEAKLKDAGVGGGVKGSGIKVSGYVDTSYLVNLADRTETGPVAGSSLQNNGRVFDGQYDAFTLNAVKLTIEKAKDNSKFPAGFRVDTIVGNDAHVLQNSTRGFTGVGESSMFIEQAYIDLGIPVGNGIDVKVGRMVSLIGYEVIESPANWQFSRSDAFRLSPKTQQGATFGYQFNDTVTATVGVINGLDASSLAIANTGQEDSNYNTELSGVGRVDVTGPKTSFGDFSAFAAGLYGNDSPVASTLDRATTYIWNLGGNWAKPFGVKPLALGIDYLYRNSETSTAAWAAAVQNQIVPVDASALSAYGKWDWNKWTTTSGRISATWYGNNRATGVAGNPISLDPFSVQTGTAGRPADTELYSFTLTQGFNVWKDTLVRLEWRHDWTPTSQVGFGAANAVSHDDIRNDQDTIAVNVVYSF